MVVLALAPAEAVALFEGVHGGKAHQLIHVGERKHGSGAARTNPLGFQMAVDRLQGARRRQKAGAGIKRDLETHGTQFRRR